MNVRGICATALIGAALTVYAPSAAMADVTPCPVSGCPTQPPVIIVGTGCQAAQPTIDALRLQVAIARTTIRREHRLVDRQRRTIHRLRAELHHS